MSQSAYDAESRQLTASDGSGAYAYDGLGRQTSIPAADAPNGTGAISLGYYVDDSAYQISQGGSTTTYGLDPDGRRLTATVAGGSPSTTVNHYGDGSDNPSWAVQTTGSVSSTSVYLGDLGGGLGATLTSDGTTVTGTLDIADPSGSVVTTIALPASGNATGIDAYAVYDEYGTLETGTPADTGALDYGWLGGKERAVGGAGLILMGARLYNTTTGRFTSTDPFPGGNENAYIYPDDPINDYDVWGLWSVQKAYKAIQNVVNTLAMRLRHMRSSKADVILGLPAYKFWAIAEIAVGALFIGWGSKSLIEAIASVVGGAASVFDTLGIGTIAGGAIAFLKTVDFWVQFIVGGFLVVDGVSRLNGGGVRWLPIPHK